MSQTPTFRRARRSHVKLRCALQGPSGSGKTYSALRLASGMARGMEGGSDASRRIALIDSETDSSAFYADSFEFDSVSLRRKTVEEYIETMRVAARERYGIIIIDSLSHAWQELVREVEMIAKARYRGNTWSAWSEGTPKQLALINALQSYPGHVITTMRVKTEWATESAGGSKSRPVRVGLAPEQRKGMEYEFDLVVEIAPDHTAAVTKGRIAAMQDRLFKQLDEDVGIELVRWLESGHVADSSEAPGDSSDGSRERSADTDVARDDAPQTNNTRSPGASEGAQAFARRLKECLTREDFDSVTAEIEAQHFEGADRELVAKAWKRQQGRLAESLAAMADARAEAAAEAVQAAAEDPSLVAAGASENVS